MVAKEEELKAKAVELGAKVEELGKAQVEACSLKRNLLGPVMLLSRSYH